MKWSVKSASRDGRQNHEKIRILHKMGCEAWTYGMVQILPNCKFVGLLYGLAS
jgi:hypothetical protein